MWKYFLLLTLTFSANAAQTKQQIIDFCKSQHLKESGNVIVLVCVEEELKAQKRLEEISRNK